MLIVSIIGSPNAGKSTLFNRIVGKKYAIVDDMPGVTRDRNILETEWVGKKFYLVDTGGYSTLPDALSKEVSEQVVQAVEKSDVLIFLVDVKTGITDIDLNVVKILQKKKAIHKTILAINKTDTHQLELESVVFERTGIPNKINISALHGINVADLLDQVVEKIAEVNEEVIESDVIRLAVIGRPNVGKSSFVNAILGEHRQIVTDIAGTTRDSIDTPFKRNGLQYSLIDTAGLRKRTKVDAGIEFFSTVRTFKAIERADTVIVIIDATVGLDRQDMNIIGNALQKKRGVLLCVNKWDLVEKDSKTELEFTRNMEDKLKNLSFIPIIYVSALTKQRVFKAIDIATEVWTARRSRISTSKLNNTLLPLIAKTPPWTKTGKEIKIKYISQLSIEPPLFGLYGNNVKIITTEYKKFLEGLFRKKFDLKGVPIEIQFRFK